MKAKQLEIFKVLEFPKNKEMEIKKMNEKFDLRNKKLVVAKALLEILSEEGADYHIIIKKKDVLKIFDTNEGCRDYLMITNNVNIGKEIKLNSKNLSVFEITGKEID